jgi:hypothetical protein
LLKAFMKAIANRGFFSHRVSPLRRKNSTFLRYLYTYIYTYTYTTTTTTMAAPLRAGRCLLLCVLYAFAGFGRATPFPGTIRGLTVVHEFDPLETSDVFYESAQDPSLIRRNLTSSDIEVLDAILADECVLPLRRS